MMELVIEGVTKRYRSGAVALDGIDLALDGGIFGLLGPNGAGKTTLMRILATLLAPSQGRVRVGPWDLARAADRHELRRVLGYLPQDLGLYPQLTAAEMIDYVALLKGLRDRAARRRRVGELLELAGLQGDRDRQIKTLSGGMRQRVGIAQALVNDPALLIVDEPTVGLDPQERIRVRTLLAGLASSRTVLLSTHIVEDVAQTCPRLAVLDQGKIRFAGPPADLLARARGQVWTTRSAPGAPPPPGVTVASVHTADATQLRTVGARPAPDAQPAEPTLEDAYVALMAPAQPAPRPHNPA
jgi:ABC-type multidrug transport system ATPase subunit